MIKINLLPLAERRPQTAYARMSAFFILVFVLLLACISAALAAQTWYAERELAATKARYEQLRPVMEAMEQANAKQSKIDSKMVMINEIAKMRIYSYEFLPQIASLMTDKLWLNETKLGSGSPNIIEVKGETALYPELAQFLSRLEADGSFKAVTLKSTEGDIKAGTLKFTIELKIKEM